MGFCSIELCYLIGRLLGNQCVGCQSALATWHVESRAGRAPPMPPASRWVAPQNQKRST